MNECIGVSGSLGTLAKRWTKDNVRNFVDGQGNILCPSNESDLSGFHYFPSSIPQLETQFGCSNSLCGWKSKGYAILYGKKDCGWEDLDSIVSCLTRFKYSDEDISAHIMPLKVAVDMPDIITQHFRHLEKDMQTSQPCTTLIKIEYEIIIKIN